MNITRIPTFRPGTDGPVLATVVDTAECTETVFGDDGATVAETRPWEPPPPSPAAAAAAALAALSPELAAQVAAAITATVEAAAAAG